MHELVQSVQVLLRQSYRNSRAHYEGVLRIIEETLRSVTLESPEARPLADLRQQLLSKIQSSEPIQFPGASANV